jgi:hypothetical protein
MGVPKLWQWFIAPRGTREREAAAQREAALREEFVRCTHALEAQIAQAHAENCRLRAENRALLNSVLGIAGIPPVIVADPSAAAGRPGADAWRDVTHSSALSSRQRREVCGDEGSAVAVHGNEQMQIPRTTPRAPEIRGTGNTARDSARDDSGNLNASGLPLVGAWHAMPGANACPDADRSTMFRGAGTPACVVSPLSRNDTSETAKKHTDKSVCATNRTRRAQAAKDPHAIAPIRRRSWHQIYRMLEFESSRRKERET